MKNLFFNMNREKIKLDLRQSSSDDDSVLSQERKIRDHKVSLYLMKRKQIVNKRLRPNQNQQTIDKYKLQMIAFMEQNKQLAKSNADYLSLVEAKTQEIAELSAENFQLREHAIHVEEEYRNLKESVRPLVDVITKNLLSADMKYLNDGSVSYVEAERPQRPTIYDMNKIQAYSKSVLPFDTIGEEEDSDEDVSMRGNVIEETDEEEDDDDEQEEEEDEDQEEMENEKEHDEEYVQEKENEEQDDATIGDIENQKENMTSPGKNTKKTNKQVLKYQKKTVKFTESGKNNSDRVSQSPPAEFIKKRKNTSSNDRRRSQIFIVQNENLPCARAQEKRNSDEIQIYADQAVDGTTPLNELSATNTSLNTSANKNDREIKSESFEYDENSNCSLNKNGTLDCTDRSKRVKKQVNYTELGVACKMRREGDKVYVKKKVRK